MIAISMLGLVLNAGFNALRARLLVGFPEKGGWQRLCGPIIALKGKRLPCSPIASKASGSTPSAR